MSNPPFVTWIDVVERLAAALTGVPTAQRTVLQSAAITAPSAQVYAVMVYFFTVLKPVSSDVSAVQSTCTCVPRLKVALTPLGDDGTTQT